ncbi:hypothetical protein [Salinibacterium sp. M195]|uniref:hypothetical protein n=1 Tax=Salinibacterium sp. M195 TaxID=2583374 RepID=UPI001C629680|nr:hypothetical protein [Salinibacterium sp. M195]QYH36335.1 hypothetical protein FFT87_10450 [Salinibacterium sp. M195]
MGTFLQKELGVAMSGVKWDVGNYKLWQSTEPDVILFTAKQPSLAKGQNGRYQMAASQFRQQEDETYKITGGSAVFTITSAVQHDAAGFAALKEQWLSEMAGVGPRPPRNPRFIPLNTQKGTAQVLINPLSGTPDAAHNDVNIGTPGGTNSFLMQLTPLGAQEWVQGIREQTAVPAGVKMMYEYLRMLPTVGAEVKVHAERIWTHFSASLGMKSGFLFGSSAQIDAAWERMKREGDVEVRFIGTGLAPELESIRQEMVNTFIDQVQQRVFDALFAPAPEVADADAGDGGGGLLGGAKFAAKFKRVEEIIDIDQKVSFEGWTWLKASMDADMTTLFSELDETYVTEVNTEMSFPATVVVDADPQLETTAISWTASEGKSPETPVFGADGGVARYIVTSARSNEVEISWRAQVNFAPASWPVVTTSGTATVGGGGNQVVIKPSSWIGRHMIYLFVRDEAGEVVFDPASPLLANSRLVANVSYEGPHLPRPISESAQISPFDPLEFSYPLSPEHAVGIAKFSAFGAIGGRMVRATEQEINFDEEGIFIVASPSSIQLVSQDAVFPESDKFLANLREHGAHPRFDTPLAGGPESESSIRPNVSRSDNRIDGVVTAVEYSAEGAALLVDTGHGHERVLLRSAELAGAFDDSRKRVVVELDAQHYADSIRVQL